MDTDDQMEAMKGCQPISINELFVSNPTVCIIPLAWWNKWCAYVGYYGYKSSNHPGDIKTESISLASPGDHAYISKQAWKLLKSWYPADEKLEVFIVNNLPDLNPMNITVDIDGSISKVVTLSLGLTVGRIKSYLCKKFNKNPDWTALSLQSEYGSIRKLKEMSEIIPKSDIYQGSLLLKKAKKLQIDAPMIVEDEVIVSISQPKTEVTCYNEDSTFELEMNEFNSYDIDYQKVNEIKTIVKHALDSEKQVIKIKSLRDLQKNLRDINEILELSFLYYDKINL